MSGTLIYPGVENAKYCSNILLIDSDVPSFETVVESVNKDTFPIVYSFLTKKNELLDFLQNNFTNIKRVGLFFASNGGPATLFLNSQPFFTNTEKNDNTQLILDIIKRYKVDNIDFLACDTLNDDSWRKYYNILTQETGVVVGASDNKTGNIKYGGDWLMESTSQDVELLYFSQNIEYYTYLLDIGNCLFVCEVTGKVYGAGTNSVGQVGTGSAGGVFSSFVNIPFFNDKKVKKITCGFRQTYALTTDNNIYGVGTNSFGQLGLGYTSSSVTAWSKMTLPEGKKPIDIFCGNNTAFVVMDDGTLYGCGRNTTYIMALPVENQNYTTLTQISIPNNETVISVSASTSFSGFVTREGNFFVAGYGPYGELGLGETDTKVSIMTSVPLPIGVKALKVSTTNISTTVLGDDGMLYSSGYSGYGVTGLGTYNDAFRLTKMPIPDGLTVKAFSSNGVALYAVLSDDKLYGTGSNSQGGLVLPQEISNVNILTLIYTPSLNKKIYKFSAYSSSVCLLLEDGTLLVGGWNGVGQLALGDLVSRYSFTQLPAPNGEMIITLLSEVVVLDCFCFKKDVKILTQDGYKFIQDLKDGDFIKTLYNGYVAVCMLGIE